MIRLLTTTSLAVTLCACGKPIESAEELARAMSGASLAGALGGPQLSAASGGDSIPSPSITLRGSHSGEATLSLNPVGVAIGLAGAGILFDVGYADYSVDGYNHLHGDLSILANFEYLAADGEDPEANFEVSFVGELGISGIVNDDAQLNLRVRTNLADLTNHSNQLVLRLNGTVDARSERFEFAQTDVTIDWSDLAER